MSRLQKHRKSQSTSALSVIADGGHMGSTSMSSGMPFERKREKRASQHPALGRVDESGPSSSTSASMRHLPGIPVPSSSSNHVGGEAKREKTRAKEVTAEDVKGWMNDVTSLRSSDRRRRAALAGLEKALLRCCVQNKRDMSGNRLTLSTMIDLHMHIPLLGLLIRHAQGLITKHPPTGEELVNVVVELSSILGLLQGLCLLSVKCKEATGESHVLEILIDLLLLLRTQPPHSAPTSLSPTQPIGYSLIELLFAVLVDCPANARNLERLGGLEAVSRVMRGSSVEKVIKMKCAEFLYFYLLPEDFKPPRAVSSSSTASASSSSSGESMLYPPSPLSSSTGSIGSGGRVSPSPLPHGSSHRRVEDMEMPFIPETPKKKPQPALGYLTPSARRVSGGSSFTTSTTPSLEPVPASPNDESIGAGTPSRRTEAPRPESRRWSVIDRAAERGDAGLGLGLPKSSSVSTNLAAIAASSSQTGMRRDVTAIELDEMDGTTKTQFSDPFSERSSSSGSSTAVPSRQVTRSSGLSRSSTADKLSSQSSRRLSVRRPSKLSDAQTSTQSGSSSMPPPSQGVPQAKIRHSRTQSHLSSLTSALPPPPVPSLTESPLVATRRKSTPPSVVPPTPALLTIPSTPNVPLAPSTPRHRDQLTPLAAQPTPAKRGFPAELTRGRIPPSSSSPALSVLGPAKRILSGKRSEVSLGNDAPTREVGPKQINGTRSVEEKKELLSAWLGNVDQLIQGVEKVSFLGDMRGAGK